METWSLNIAKTINSRLLGNYDFSYPSKTEKIYFKISERNPSCFLQIYPKRVAVTVLKLS